MVLHVLVYHEGGQVGVELQVYLVADDAEDVETGENWVGEVDVLAEGLLGVVAAFYRVGGGDYGAAGVQGGDDAGFGD